MVEIKVNQQREEVVSGPTKEVDEEATNYDDKITYEPPIEPAVFDKVNIVKWSNTYKQLLVNPKGKAIAVKAKRFIEEDCIGYDKEKKCYLCKPIKGYNKTTYEMKNNKEMSSGFECTCQFHNKVVVKEKHLICSHVCALKMQLKIWNSQRRKDKKDFPEAYL